MATSIDRLSTVRQLFETTVNYVIAPDSTMSKQQSKVLNFLRDNTKISKAEALVLKVGNIAEVVRQLRKKGYTIHTVETHYGTFYSL